MNALLIMFSIMAAICFMGVIGSSKPEERKHLSAIFVALLITILIMVCLKRGVF